MCGRPKGYRATIIRFVPVEVGAIVISPRTGHICRHSEYVSSSYCWVGAWYSIIFIPRQSQKSSPRRPGNCLCTKNHLPPHIISDYVLYPIEIVIRNLIQSSSKARTRMISTTLMEQVARAKPHKRALIWNWIIQFQTRRNVIQLWNVGQGDVHIVLLRKIVMPGTRTISRSIISLQESAGMLWFPIWRSNSLYSCASRMKRSGPMFWNMFFVLPVVGH